MENPNQSNLKQSFVEKEKSKVETPVSLKEGDHQEKQPPKPKAYFTRWDLIILGLTMFYSLLLVFTGICIQGGSTSIVNRKNPLALLSLALGFPSIDVKTSGFVTLALVAVYLSLFAFAFLFERRYAVINHKKTFSYPQILIYLGTFLLCGLLSVGLACLIQLPGGASSISASFAFLGQSLLLSLLIYLVFAALIASILLIFVNLIKIDKPIQSHRENPDILEEPKDLDVAESFEENDTKSSIAPSFAYGETTGIPQTTPVLSKNDPSSLALEDRTKVFPGLSQIDEKHSGVIEGKMAKVDITLPLLSEQFQNFLAAKEHLYYDLDTLRFFLAGFGTSHLSILEGLSGTGKSSLPRSFAKFVHGTCVFLPVQATWRDKTALLGYFNEFSKTYTETDFLKNLYEANYNPDQIYLFVLDEMNISRVEYYFADFLSILEYPKEEWKVGVMQLPYGFLPPALLENGKVKIPANAFFVGTANQDDSTFSIADKVYDRAIAIDFDKRNAPFVPKGKSDAICLGNSQFASLLEEAKENPNYQLTSEAKEKFMKVTDRIYDDFGIAFGNRILNQIETFVPCFVGLGGKKEDALDFLLTQKVLVKLDGRFEDSARQGLKNILSLLEEEYGAGAFSRSETEVRRLLKRI